MEAVDIAAIEVCFVCAEGGLVDVSLYDVSIEARIEPECSFDVYFVSRLEEPEVGLLECFLHCCGGIFRAIGSFEREADSVVAHTLGGAEFSDEWAGEPEGFVGSLGLDVDYCCEPFYDS